VQAPRSPESMTVAERQAEIANILARGLMRSVRLARSRTSVPAEKVSEAGESDLDLSAKLPLSVAPRPAG
jgi:uncharacterized protein (AIM24 family)